jgi:hypothetical protein
MQHRTPRLCLLFAGLASGLVSTPGSGGESLNVLYTGIDLKLWLAFFSRSSQKWNARRNRRGAEFQASIAFTSRTQRSVIHMEYWR